MLDPIAEPMASLDNAMDADELRAATVPGRADARRVEPREALRRAPHATARQFHGSHGYHHRWRGIQLGSLSRQGGAGRWCQDAGGAALAQLFCRLYSPGYCPLYGDGARVGLPGPRQRRPHPRHGVVGDVGHDGGDAGPPVQRGGPRGCQPRPGGAGLGHGGRRRRGLPGG